MMTVSKCLKCQREKAPKINQRKSRKTSGKSNSRGCSRRVPVPPWRSEMFSPGLFWPQVLKAVMLFPTIERMAQSPQGKVMTPVLCQMRYLAYLPVFFFSLLPAGLRAFLVKLTLGHISSLDQCVIPPCVELLSGDCAGQGTSGWRLSGLMTRSFIWRPFFYLCAANSIYMGGQEMKKVVERDNITIKKNLDKVRNLF